jgi:hypothetical protein
MVRNDSLDLVDDFGKKPRIGDPGYVTPLPDPPPVPTPYEGCTEQQKQDVIKAMDSACERIKNCNNPDCDQNELLALKAMCASKKTPQIRCPKAGSDEKCDTPDQWGRKHCAYAGDPITLCPRAFPADGSNCGDIPLFSTLIHEMTHNVSPIGADPDDANKMQACMGLKPGAPHHPKTPITGK